MNTIHPEQPAEFEEMKRKIGKKYMDLPAEDQIKTLASIFGAKNGTIRIIKGTDKWRGCSHVRLHFDNGTWLHLGSTLTRTAKTKRYQNEQIAFAVYDINPEIISYTESNAFKTLKNREAVDNQTAYRYGLKPYTLLNVEFDPNSTGGFYYLTLAVQDEILTFFQPALHWQIKNGELDPHPKSGKYQKASGLREEDVHFVFNNEGQTLNPADFTIPLTKEVLERAEIRLQQEKRITSKVLSAKKTIPYDLPAFF